MDGYVEARQEEDWKSVSRLFQEWISANIDLRGLTFGFHEGDPVRLPDGRLLLSFRIPDHHGEKVVWFEQWARTTNRLFGRRNGRTIRFPAEPDLAVDLPEPKIGKLPPWIR